MDLANYDGRAAALRGTPMANQINDEDFANLADKLENLELTEGERIVLNAIIENADEEADVTGFSFKPEGGLGYDNAAHLLNTNITKGRIQLGARFGSFG